MKREIDPKSVVSPAQVRALADIVALLVSSGESPDVSVEYGDLATPFDLRICVETKDLVIHLYPDGADVSGRVQIRLEIEDYENTEDPEPLFRDFKADLSEGIKRLRK